MRITQRKMCYVAPVTEDSSLIVPRSLIQPCGMVDRLLRYKTQDAYGRQQHATVAQDHGDNQAVTTQKSPVRLDLLSCP